MLITAGMVANGYDAAFAEQTFKVGGEPIVATSLFGYPEKMKYQAVETRELIERELLRR